MNSLLSEHLQKKAGEKLGTSSWTTITQQQIDLFGQVTHDPDPLHVDPQWCREHSPFGKPIAFGFLTVSLLTSLYHEVMDYAREERTDESFGLNYGFDKLRLVAPVPVDSRIRGHFWVDKMVQKRPGEFVVTVRAEIEIEGETRPALVASWLAMIVEEQGHHRLIDRHGQAD